MNAINNPFMYDADNHADHAAQMARQAKHDLEAGDAAEALADLRLMLSASEMAACFARLAIEHLEKQTKEPGR